MDAANGFTVDRRAFSVASLDDRPDDRAYWHAASPNVRLRFVEVLRQINYGVDQSAARLQRVLEVTQRDER